MLQIKQWIVGTLCGLFVSFHIAVVGGFIGCPEYLKLSDTYSGGWTADNSEGRRSEDPDLIWEVPEWKDAGQGQTRLLYQDYEKVAGKPYKPRAQGNAPSCVGQAVAAAVDFLACIEIMAGEPERLPPAPASAEVIYGLSRIEIGEVTRKFGGGSHNIWAVQAITRYGVVARLNYPLLNQDLRKPSPSKAVYFGRKGIPSGLEVVARIHPIKDYVSIDSYEECRDAIYTGHPVVVGSNQGFGKKKVRRDSEGFLSPPWRLFFPSTWNHSMVIIGVCDEGRRGCLVLNSWGTGWIRGAKRFGDEPLGSFWVDWDIIDRMVKQGDAFAIRGFKGYADYRLFSQEDENVYKID